jgi:putative transposase
LAEIKKALAERMLNAELDQHLDDEAAGSASNGEVSSNHRNGYSKKTVITDTSQAKPEIPRDRRGTFEPQLISTGDRCGARGVRPMAEPAP